jgi:proliferating cell nuclear antigen
MDNSHVALVAVKLDADGFDLYRCDRPMPLGVNLGSLTKVLKCAKDDDMVTLKATDNGDILNLIYEAKSMFYVQRSCLVLLNQFVYQTLIASRNMT